MAKIPVIFRFLAVLIFFVTANAADAPLSEKCTAEFQKVTMCLPFASAKVATPNRECCGAVTDLRGSDPACLCYMIQLVHNGTNAAVKSMEIQESRLLQLPSACHLVNASVSECPRLLHLPPNSPDAAIFANASTLSNTTTPIAAPGGTSSDSTGSHSRAFRHKPQLVVLIAASIIYGFSTASGRLT